MTTIPSNIDFFNYSKKNPEPYFDSYYVFIEENNEIEKYIENSQKIKNILITIKTLKENNENKLIIDKYFKELKKNINKYSNATEFSCFINACDNSIKDIVNEEETLKIIVEKYFEKRIFDESVPRQWVQALIDNNSSRKKGKCAENKLLDLLSKFGFTKVVKLEDLKNYKFSVYSCNDKLEKIRNEFNIRINTKTQNKKPDLVIKIGKKIFILEAKHLNTSGGAQDKQISELIELINLLEDDENVGFISFLDGKYSNKILDDDLILSGQKLLDQKMEINQNLKKNPKNYWLNTAGFNEFLRIFTCDTK